MSVRFGVGMPWWSQAFVDLLPPKTSLANIDRGRTLARDGMVGELRLQPGHVAANVGSGGRTGAAALTIPPLDDASRSRAIEVLAGAIRHAAALAEGHLDPVLADELEAAGVPLLPDRAEVGWEDDLAPSPPGVHAVALVHAVAAAIGQDPFLLLELRGVGRRDEVVAAIRRQRGGEADEVVDDVAEVAPVGPEAYWSAGAIDDVHVHPQPLGTGEITVDRLGPPPRVEEIRPLEELVVRAADTAWRLAAGEGAGAADDEVLLAELRAARMATATSLAETLGWDVGDVVDALQRLYADGKVLRTGTDERARYRAT